MTAHRRARGTMALGGKAMTMHDWRHAGGVTIDTMPEISGYTCTRCGLNASLQFWPDGRVVMWRGYDKQPVPPCPADLAP